MSQLSSTPFSNPKPHNASNNSELKALFQRFPTPTDFLRAYPIALQQRILSAGLTPAKLADKKEIPTLALLAHLYGNSTPIEWLKSHLASLNSLSEARMQMTIVQLEETAQLILSAHSQLTAADICLFIARIKIGTYGPFYGCIDPLKIMRFLTQYVDECRRSRTSTRQPEPPATSDVEERKPATYEMYLETRRRAAAGDPEAIRELQRPPGK